MHPNTKVLHDFYLAFQSKNFKVMQSCYSEDAHFSDPVFQNLNAAQVRSMWEMLLTAGSDLQVVFNDVEANDTDGRAHWMATYTFTKTGRKVVNDVHSSFEFDNGKIVKQTDKFSLPRWSQQAFGLKGRLLGRTSFMQNQIRQGARASLEKFSQRQGQK